MESLKIEELAQEILLLAQRRLMVDLRFLCKASQQFKLNGMKEEELDGLMATDGKELCYVPEG